MSANDSGAAGPYAGRTFIIMNPVAGQDEPARLRRLIGGAFAARGAAFDLTLTEAAGHATELASRAAALGYRAVCVVGGDGTLAEAATALAGTATPLALIPRGTGNQLALNLDIPLDMEAAVDVVLAGRLMPLDLGRVNGRAFALVAGAGLDAAVMARATRELKERWGFAAYIFAAVKEALTAAPANFHVVADGKAFDVAAIGVMLANAGSLFTSYLPLRFPLGPDPARSFQDGLLDVVILAPQRMVEFPSLLWRAAHGHFAGDARLVHLQAREVTVTADPPLPVQVDGDPFGTTPITATVVQADIRFLVP